jgi:hypothetical protein
MNPSVASKVLDILVHADIAYYGNNVPYEKFITPYYNKALGELKRELKRILNLRQNIGTFIGIFIEEMLNE